MTSFCTRCRIVILPEEFDDYLKCDHVCAECSNESASEYQQRIKENEKQARVKA